MAPWFVCSTCGTGYFSASSQPQEHWRCSRCGAAAERFQMRSEPEAHPARFQRLDESAKGKRLGVRAERRSGVDRRSGRERRTRLEPRPERLPERRSGPDRRRGRDRRTRRSLTMDM
jgi:DNA-directed RNA polymerase subunit RPC12/RpoP